MSQSKFFFLCGNFERRNFIYAVKSKQSDWYYFEEEDSIIDEHRSLPVHLETKINLLKMLLMISCLSGVVRFFTILQDIPTSEIKFSSDVEIESVY